MGAAGPVGAATAGCDEGGGGAVAPTTAPFRGVQYDGRGAATAGCEGGGKGAEGAMALTHAPTVRPHHCFVLQRAWPTRASHY